MKSCLQYLLYGSMFLLLGNCINKETKFEVNCCCISLYQNDFKKYSLNSLNGLLELIYYNDQKYRYIADQYQDTSVEFSQIWDTIKQIDSINICCIKSVFTTYGYPMSEGYSEIALIAPWVVLQHSLDSVIRKKYFIYLYDAYTNDVISEGEMWFYLNRSYVLEFQDDYQIERLQITTREKIDYYIAELKYLDP